ncbi:MAG TPA: integrase arm-type DNA-binding domain-containing protein [Stellaceae bacterium]|nr:integrase arm-type DNA-binding domain-containing protein [Stellaceae bacterium]
MARLGKLTAHAVDTVKAPGMYADGGGLYLQVAVAKEGAEPAKSWVYRYMLNGRAREMGLGSLATFTLKRARDRARRAREMCADGIDPIEARRAQRAKAALEAAQAIPFADCARRYVEAHKAGWRNAKHAAQWESTLKTYAEPILGRVAVQSIDTAVVMKVLEQKVGDGEGRAGQPLWSARPETASRLRGRLEVILDWAKVRGYRVGENPARWRGHLDKLLPAPGKVRRVKHHAALPFVQVADFLTALRAQEGLAARAFEFAILTAARTGEVLGAQWREIDLAEKVWTVPAGRMKAGREHRVPLSDPALAILAKIKERAQGNGPQPDAFVFASKPGQPLSNMAFLMLLRRMGRDDLTAHGFRSTFRDWAAERTDYPREVAEMALAHAVSDKVEAAYRRGDLFHRRRQIMTDWAAFCGAAKAATKRGHAASARPQPAA